MKIWFHKHRTFLSLTNSIRTEIKNSWKIHLLLNYSYIKQCRINHMAEVAYATGLALLGASCF